MSIAIIQKMYSQMDWADQRLLALMNRDPFARTQPAMRFFSHLLAAERVWLLRLLGEDSSVQPIWPDLAPEALDALAAENRTGYAQYLASLDEDGLPSEVAYTNQQGSTYRTRVDDILIHVATHGSYHRGQIAAAVRAAGGEPVNTDYITYVRNRTEATA